MFVLTVILFGRSEEMCKRGTLEQVEVTIPAHLSSTGKPGKTVKLIDKCIAPLVKALNDAGITTILSCCGHGKVDGQINLADGRILVIKRVKK